MERILAIGVIVVLSALRLAAQYDARTVPLYLRPAEELEGVSFRKPSFWVKAPQYPPGTEKHVSRYQQGLVSPDGFPIANACNGAPYDQTETWIVVNPRDPNNIIANSNDMQYNGPNGYRMTAFVTKDGAGHGIGIYCRAMRVLDDLQVVDKPILIQHLHLMPMAMHIMAMAGHA